MFLRRIFFNVRIPGFLSGLFLLTNSIAMAASPIIPLPSPTLKGKTSLEESILRRRSERSFQDKKLTLAEIGQLLWSAQGITEKKRGKNLRSAPSAGALYPLEVYVFTPEGIFYYLPETHALEEILGKDSRPQLAEASLGQEMITRAPVSIVFCAVYERVTARYGQRGVRYVDMEAGHAAQNIHLQAVALGLGSVPVGAFDGKKVKAILRLPAEVDPLYIIPVGYVR